MHLIARKIYKIGLQELKMDDEGDYYLFIRNRTYFNKIKLTPKQAEIYKQEMIDHD